MEKRRPKVERVKKYLIDSLILGRKNVGNVSTYS